MQEYMTQSKATQILAAEQTHSDMHAGRGVIDMPTHDQIANRAHEIYVRSGCKHGQCEQNWHQAERELRAAKSGT